MPPARLNRLNCKPIDVWPFQTELLVPKGLFGFEQYTSYWLIGHKKNSPFLRLEARENRALFFYVIDPFLGHPTYDPMLTKNDLKDLGVVKDANLIMLAIVNTKEKPFTMNLSAPLLIHWLKKQGKQLLIPHDSEFPLSVIT